MTLNKTKNFVELEISSYTGVIPDSLSKNDILIVYNCLLAERYNLKKISFTKKQTINNFKPVYLFNLVVPYYIYRIDFLFRGKFFLLNFNENYESFESYIMQFIRYSAYKSFSKFHLVTLKRSYKDCFPIKGKNFLTKSRLKSKDLDENLLVSDLLFQQRHDSSFLHSFYSDLFFMFNFDVSNFINFFFSFFCAREAYIEKIFDIKTYQGRVGFLGWFNRWGISQLPHYTHPKFINEYLNSFSTQLNDSKNYGLTILIESIYYSDNELAKIYDIKTSEGILGLVNWFNDYKNIDNIIYKNYSNDKKVNLNKATKKTLVPNTVHTNKIVATNNSEANKSLDKGLNIIGWPLYSIGIGEDCRSLIEVVKSTNINFTVLDASTVMPTSLPKEKNQYIQYINPQRKYNHDLVSLDPSTLYRTLFILNEIQGTSNSKVIAACPWEFSKWPTSYSYVFNDIDYFFAISNFVFDAFKEYFSDDQIFLAPPFINDIGIPSIKNEDLSRDILKFITIFDGSSSLSRKNPIAVVKAFKIAFPKEKDVQLTVKMMNSSRTDNNLNLLFKEIGSDSRIIVINKILDKKDLYHLISSHHSFISLHRSEGFGRNIAEAMLMEKIVISSNYSGNLDFNNTSNSFLIDGKLIKVKKGEYSSGYGLEWFDPDIFHAADNMKIIYDDFTSAFIKAQKGRSFILERYSIDAISSLYAQIFSKIF
jgi:hypothetical protein